MRDYFMKAAVDTSGASQRLIAGLKPGEQLRLIKEPDNPDDKYAIRLETMTGENVGYISRVYSQRISVTMKYGFKYKVLVAAVTGGKFGSKHFGIDLRVLYDVPDLSKLKIKKKKKSSK